jgi:hypothetical protein
VGLEAPHPQVQAVCVETAQLTDTYKGACARTRCQFAQMGLAFFFNNSIL